jgi:ubiquinone/menaquinone biosynthesis C-methylase UbiE
MTMIPNTQGPAPATPTPELDLAAIKKRQQATWASGDFAIIGTTLQIVGETLCEAADLRAGERILDVACGNGNATLAAARRFCRVTGADYVPELLAKAAARAQAEGLAVDLHDADAEDLPFPDATFDAVLSTFGVMFAPDHPRAARELLRVCRPGGRIALASWTPEGFIGELLRVVGRHVPPPKGLTPPSAWGKEEHIARLFGDAVTKVQVRRRHFAFRYLSAAHFIDVFRTYYGPTHKAFGALDAPGQASLEADMKALAEKHDRGEGHGLVVPAEYLEVVATRR